MSANGTPIVSPRTAEMIYLTAAQEEQTLERQMAHAVWRLWWQYMNTPSEPLHHAPAVLTRMQWQTPEAERVRINDVFALLTRTGKRFDTKMIDTMRDTTCLSALYETIWLVHARRESATPIADPECAIYRMLSEICNSESVDFIFAAFHKLRRKFDREYHTLTRLGRGQWTRQHAERFFFISQFVLLTSYRFDDRLWNDTMAEGEPLRSNATMSDFFLGIELNELQRLAAVNNLKGVFATRHALDASLATQTANNNNNNKLGTLKKPTAPNRAAAVEAVAADPSPTPLTTLGINEEKLKEAIRSAETRMRNNSKSRHRKQLSATNGVGNNGSFAATSSNSGIRAQVVGDSVTIENTSSGNKSATLTSKIAASLKRSVTVGSSGNGSSEGAAASTSPPMSKRSAHKSRQSFNWYKAPLIQHGNTGTSSNLDNLPDDEDDAPAMINEIDASIYQNSAGASAMQQVIDARAQATGGQPSETKHLTEIDDNPLMLYELARQLVQALDRHFAINNERIGIVGVQAFLEGDGKSLLATANMGGRKNMMDAMRMVHTMWNGYMGQYPITPERTQLIETLVKFCDMLANEQGANKMRSYANDLMTKRFHTEAQHWDQEVLIHATTIAFYDALKRFFEGIYSRLDSELVSRLHPIESESDQRWLRTIEQLIRDIRELRDTLIEDFRAEKTVPVVNSVTGEVTYQVIGFAATVSPRQHASLSISSPSGTASPRSTQQFYATAAAPDNSTKTVLAVERMLEKEGAQPQTQSSTTATSNNNSYVKGVPTDFERAGWRSGRAPRISNARSASTAALTSTSAPTPVPVVSVPSPRIDANPGNAKTLLHDQQPTGFVQYPAVRTPISLATDDIDDDAESSSTNDTAPKSTLFGSHSTRELTTKSSASSTSS